MGKAKSLNCRILALGGMPDHLHAVVRMHPATSVARLAQELKGASSYHINHVLRPDEKLRWQGGYGAFTCWERGIGVVVKYVETQRTRHASSLWVPWHTLTRADARGGVGTRGRARHPSWEHHVKRPGPSRLLAPISAT